MRSAECGMRNTSFILGWPRHAAERLFYSGRARCLGRGIDPHLPTRRLGVAGLSGPAFERFGIIPFRRWWRRNLIGVLQAIEGKRFDQLRFRSGAAINRIHAGQMPRAAEGQDDSNQGSDEAGPKVMALHVARRGIDGGLGNTPHSQSRECFDILEQPRERSVWSQAIISCRAFINIRAKQAGYGLTPTMRGGRRCKSTLTTSKQEAGRVCNEIQALTSFGLRTSDFGLYLPRMVLEF